MNFLFRWEITVDHPHSLAPSVPRCIPVTLDSFFFRLFVSCSCRHLQPLEWLRPNLTAFAPYRSYGRWPERFWKDGQSRCCFSALPAQAGCQLERGGRGNLRGLTEGALLGAWSDYTAKRISSRRRGKKEQKLHLMLHCGDFIGNFFQWPLLCILFWKSPST